MFKNYLKTAFRNLWRNKGISMINLAGLTLGISCSLVLFLMVLYMSSYDAFQTKRDRIYRVVNQWQGNSGIEYQSGVPAVLPEAFRTDFPEAEEVVFISEGRSSLVSIPQKNGEYTKYQEDDGIAFTEPSYLKVFDRTIVFGDAGKGLDEPNEAIIAAGWAKKYFGKEDVVGEILKYDDNEYRITAVMEDAPPNTDFPFNMLLSYSTIKKVREEAGWNSIWSGEQCYFLLKENEPIARVENRMPAFSKKYLGDDAEEEKSRFFLLPLTAMHFDERFDTYSETTVSRASLIGFAAIGIILIITASINFINLSTAEAIKRSKEVGVRKSLGSTRGQLVRQFLGETTLVTLVAIILALSLTQIMLGFVNPFMKMNLSLDFTNGMLWVFLVLVTAVVSILSGLYPAFVVSGFKPALALKNLVSNKNSSGYMLRKSLVVMQFCISQVLIIGTIVIVNQIRYSQTKELGFAKDAIIIAPIPEKEKPNAPGSGVSKMRTLREEVARIPGVAMASLGSAPPSYGHVSSTDFTVQGAEKSYETQVKMIDGNYLDLYKIELLEGQNLQDLDTANGYLVNERLAYIAGYTKPADLVGKVIQLWGKDFPVVGVVKNFHTMSLHEPIEATILFNRIRGYETLAIKVDMNKAQQVISDLKSKWEATYPEHLFEYQFLDQNIGEFYEGEQRLSVLLTIFTSMAIFIGCLGLFGLATFMANQKTKEIGVRKVLGASVESIVLMFSKEYVKLILLGFVFAAPLGWFVMNRFLEKFVYKIELGVPIFLMTLGATLLIAMITVGYKSFRAATINPVNSLRSE